MGRLRHDYDHLYDSGLSTGGTLTVTGAATLSSTLAVTGAATLSSTLAVTGAATFTGKINLGLNGGAASASGLLMGVGTSANPATTAVANAKFVEIRAQSSATSGDNRLAYLRYDQSGAAGGGECLRALGKITAALGTARGAHISADLSAAGSCSGLCVGVDAQLMLVDALPAGGNYFAGQSEVFLSGASADTNAVTLAAVHSFKTNGNDTNSANLINLFAVTTLAGQRGNKAAKLMFGNDDVTTGGACTGGLQINVDGTQYWLPLYSI